MFHFILLWFLRLMILIHILFSIFFWCLYVFCFCSDLYFGHGNQSREKKKYITYKFEYIRRISIITFKYNHFHPILIYFNPLILTTFSIYLFFLFNFSYVSYVAILLLISCSFMFLKWKILMFYSRHIFVSIIHSIIETNNHICLKTALIFLLIPLFISGKL